MQVSIDGDNPLPANGIHGKNSAIMHWQVVLDL
jgi:hypothetical protein